MREARRLPRARGPDGARLLAVGSERPLQAAEMTKASAGVVEAGARMRGEATLGLSARSHAIGLPARVDS